MCKEPIKGHDVTCPGEGLPQLQGLQELQSECAFPAEIDGISTEILSQKTLEEASEDGCTCRVRPRHQILQGAGTCSVRPSRELRADLISSPFETNRDMKHQQSGITSGWGRTGGHCKEMKS